jgi:CHAD domain-containing protein
MDMLTELATSVHVNAGEKQHLVELLEYLGAKRSKRAKKLRKVAKKDGPSLRRNLAALSEKIDRLVQSAAKDPCDTITRQSSALAHLASELKSPSRLNSQNLHPYRLKVKALRYALQLSDQPKEAELVSTLGDVKTRLANGTTGKNLRRLLPRCWTTNPNRCRYGN